MPSSTLVAYDSALAGKIVGPAALSDSEDYAGAPHEKGGLDGQGGGVPAQKMTTKNFSTSSTCSSGVSVPFSQLSDLFERLISHATIVDQGEAYREWSAGKVSILPVQTVGQPPYKPLVGGPSAQCCVKTGYVENGDAFVIKIASGGADGCGNTGFLLVFSQKTMQLTRQLNDEGILTEIRTAAATCFASQLLYFGLSKLEPPRIPIRHVGLLGAGVQAVWQLRFLRLITDCRSAKVYVRNPVKGRTFENQMKQSPFLPDREWKIEIVEDVGEVGRHCQLIHTLTGSKEELLVCKHLYWTNGNHHPGRSSSFATTKSKDSLRSVSSQSSLNSTASASAGGGPPPAPRQDEEPQEQLARRGSTTGSTTSAQSADEVAVDRVVEPTGRNKRRQHISAVGADAPGKSEIGLDVLLSADVLVCDSKEQTFERGEFQKLKAWEDEEVITNVKEIGDLMALMTSEEAGVDSLPDCQGLTVFDTSGIAVQDVHIAQMVAQMLDEQEVEPR
eukprot:g18055.t1